MRAKIACALVALVACGAPSSVAPVAPRAAPSSSPARAPATSAPPAARAIAVARDLVATMLPACVVKGAAWDDGLVELRATPDAAPFAAFALADELSILIPTEGPPQAVVARIDGFTLDGFAPGARLARGTASAFIDGYLAPTEELLYEAREKYHSGEHFVMRTRPAGFADDVVTYFRCDQLAVGHGTPRSWHEDAKWKFGWLRKGATIEIRWDPERDAIQHVAIEEDTRVAITEDKGAFVRVEWRRCDVRVHGYVAAKDVARAAPGKWVAAQDGPCPRVAVAPVVPRGARFTCGDAVPLLAVAGDEARVVGRIGAGAPFVVVKRDAELAYVGAPSGRVLARPGVDLAIAAADAARCAPAAP